MQRTAIAEAGHWTLSKRRTLVAHRNAGLEIVLISRGLMRWHVEGRVEEVTPGSVFFTLPWETHGGVEEQEPGGDLHFVSIRLDRPYCRAPRRFAWHAGLGLSGRRSEALRRRLLAAPRRCWPATPTLAAVLPSLVAEHGRAECDVDALHAWARLAVVELGRCVSGSAAASVPRADAEARVRAFLDRLETTCGQRWTLGQMADACDLGRTRFAALCLQVSGDRPVMALHRARIRRARHLLAATDQPITRIALACGYATSQHFAEVFRAYAGCCARDYRQAARSAKNTGKS